jgi:aryl-alcohol dehydrogenase-like predicted oxidoreductase
VTAIQSDYSFMERSPERNGVLKICEELGIGFVPWGPVGMVAPGFGAACWEVAHSRTPGGHYRDDAGLLRAAKSRGSALTFSGAHC